MCTARNAIQQLLGVSDMRKCQYCGYVTPNSICPECNKVTAELKTLNLMYMQHVIDSIHDLRCDDVPCDECPFELGMDYMDICKHVQNDWICKKV